MQRLLADKGDARNQAVAQGFDKIQVLESLVGTYVFLTGKVL